MVAYDFGLKLNILRNLAAAGCTVTVVPAHTTAAEALALEARRHLHVERARATPSR